MEMGLFELVFESNPPPDMALNLCQVSHTFLTLNEILFGNDREWKSPEWKLMSWCRIYIFIFMNLCVDPPNCH